MQCSVGALIFIHLVALISAKSSFSRLPPPQSQTTESTATGEEESTDRFETTTIATFTATDEGSDSSRTTAEAGRGGEGTTEEGWHFHNAGSKLKCEACKMIAGWLKLSTAPSGSAALSSFLDAKCGTTLVLAGWCKELVRNQIEKLVPTDAALCRRTINAC
uniref:Saposin B-type domain-containing protein n=1 Tax=Plectus sambesii TaxID=2011161 RepID=A0A914XJW0_9BILA